MYAIRRQPILLLWDELYLRNPLLASFGFLNLLCFIGLIPISLVDERTLLGISVWIKPMKFFVSIAIFVWTMGFFLHYLPQKKSVKAISWILVGVFVVEMSAIVGQAAMGKTSHFNIATPWDATLFSMMGIAIIVNTVAVGWAFLLFLQPIPLPKGFLWGIRLGLGIFLLASLEGYLMVQNMGHTIGAADGVEGWFFLNWAKQYGDLRIAHFLGLHALQAVPLFAWFFSREKVQPVVWFGCIYMLLAVATLLQALAGIPLIWMNS